MMKTCENCACNPVCDHMNYGFVTCGNWIPLRTHCAAKTDMQPIDLGALLKVLDSFSTDMVRKSDILQAVTSLPILDIWPRMTLVDAERPPIGQKVLVYYGGDYALSEIIMEDYEGNAMWGYTGLGSDTPSHWSALPPKPDKKEP